MRRFMITHAIFLWFCGKTVAKSIVISFYFHLTISNDCKSFGNLWYFVFTFWHTKYLDMNHIISLFISCYKKYCFKSGYIIMPLWCIEYTELWTSKRISHRACFWIKVIHQNNVQVWPPSWFNFTYKFFVVRNRPFDSLLFSQSVMIGVAKLLITLLILARTLPNLASLSLQITHTR